jgi:hypothetical protein
LAGGIEACGLVSEVIAVGWKIGAAGMEVARAVIVVVNATAL